MMTKWVTIIVGVLALTIVTYNNVFQLIRSTVSIFEWLALLIIFVLVSLYYAYNHKLLRFRLRRKKKR